MSTTPAGATTDMALTSEEIASKEFLVGLRGYDKDEVRAFLQSVAAAFDESATTSNGAAEAPASGGGMANLGGQIEAILATANAEADKLRSDAQADAARVRAEADSYAESTRAQAEQHENEARQKLTAAQDEALGIVADAQARAARMEETTLREAEEKANAAVAHLTAQIGELTGTRDTSKASLEELRTKIDKAITVASEG
ncbi:MAG: DivIVA domain-containing protein [Acidimicrobiales bacterium]|nr:DivIVA domain-containing protein [Acidimicrobiales bacterium]HRW36879.1 DivIVA domain-containing protein [Aquihabitans sp.]